MLLWVGLSLSLGLACCHTGLKHAPHQLLAGESGGGASLADSMAKTRYVQKLDEVIIVQIELRLAALEHGVYRVAQPLGAFLFVHPASPVLLRFQDSTARPRCSVNVRGHRV